MCSVRNHSKQSAELGNCSSLLVKFTPQVTSVTFKFTARVTFKFTAQVSPHLKQSLLVDQVSMCTVRAHLKQLAEVGHCSSLLLKLPASPSSLLPESPSSLVPIKFTTSVTFKFTAKVTFKFTARGCKQYIKFTASVTFKFTVSHLQVYPPQICQISA